MSFKGSRHGRKGHDYREEESEEQRPQIGISGFLSAVISRFLTDAAAKDSWPTSRAFNA